MPAEETGGMQGVQGVQGLEGVLQLVGVAVVMALGIRVVVEVTVKPLWRVLVSMVATASFLGLVVACFTGLLWWQTAPAAWREFTTPLPLANVTTILTSALTTLATHLVESIFS